MDKAYLHHLWVRIRVVRPWYFLVLAFAFACLSIGALRANNIEMSKLRNDVFVADKNNDHITEKLQTLQMYVTSHMNTDLSTGPNAPYPPIQLQYTYDRAVLAAGEQATAANSQLYTDAQNYCEQLIPTGYYGTGRVPCVQQYLHDHSEQSVPTIPDSLYKFDFASPWWSPDLAGWSIFATIVFAIVFVVYGVFRWWIKRASK